MPINKKELIKLYAIAMFESRLPFSTLERLVTFSEFIKALRPNFQLLTRQKLSIELLDICNKDVKDQVQRVIDTHYLKETKDPYLNTISDKSTSVNRARIVNISINTSDRQSFYIKCVDSGPIT